MFNQFTHLVSNASGWAYAVVFVLALLDAILPVVPSETAVITAGGSRRRRPSVAPADRGVRRSRRSGR